MRAIAVDRQQERCVMIKGYEVKTEGRVCRVSVEGQQIGYILCVPKVFGFPFFVFSGFLFPGERRAAGCKQMNGR